jgi:hypothetical protein
VRYCGSIENCFVSHITCKIWGFHSSTNDHDAMSTRTSVLPAWVLSTSSISDPDSWLCVHVTAVYLLLYSQKMCGKGVIQTNFKFKPLGRGISAFYYQTTVHMWLKEKELVKGVTLPSHCTNSLWVKRMCWNFLRADIHVKRWRFSDVSESDSVPIFRVLLVVW